jgi:hypothetical protein
MAEEAKVRVLDRWDNPPCIEGEVVAVDGERVANIKPRPKRPPGVLEAGDMLRDYFRRGIEEQFATKNTFSTIILDEFAFADAEVTRNPLTADYVVSDAEGRELARVTEKAVREMSLRNDTPHREVVKALVAQQARTEGKSLSLEYAKRGCGREVYYFGRTR